MSVGGHLYLFKTCLNCLNSLIRTKHCKSHEVNLKSGDLVYLMSASSKVFVKKDCFLHLRGKTHAHKTFQLGCRVNDNSIFSDEFWAFFTNAAEQRRIWGR